jgi:hypothetical protein
MNAERIILRVFLYIAMSVGLVAGLITPFGWIIFAVCLSGLACSASRE